MIGAAVVDASVAVKWVVEEPGSAQARTLWRTRWNLRWNSDTRSTIASIWRSPLAEASRW